jgi:tripartite-type tricarboxylate transporter receptor subunit TctC
MKTLWAVSLALMLSAAMAPGAQAQAPAPGARTIRMITTVPPGSAPDVATRTIAKRLSTDLGVPVVVENRTGAGGLIGATAAAGAAPDGTTVLLADTGVFAVLPHFHPQFDPLKALVPITAVGPNPLFLAVGAHTGVTNVKDLIALAKSKPGLPYGSGGTGGAAHLYMELFQVAAGVQMTHIPYKGVAPAVQSLVGGEVNAVFSGLNLLLPLEQANRLKIIAVGAPTRVRRLPNLPTLAEAGLPNAEIGPLNFGLFAPAGTPPDVVARLREQFSAAIKAPEVRQKLDELSVDEPADTSSAALGEIVRVELARYGKIIKSANVKPE